MEKTKISKETNENLQEFSKSSLCEEYIGSTYLELTQLGGRGEEKTELVQHRGSGRIAVKKEVSAKSAEIYQKLRELEHPNIVRIYEVCQNEKGGIVIEEFVSGETLECKLEDGPLPEEQVLKYAIQILDALWEIHKRNIIHRDITLSNVLISSDDVVKIIDFGISRNWKENQGKDTDILGTVGYAAPEQFGFQQTDITADFYAFGVLINVMLTGKMPMEEKTRSKKFEKVVKKCLQMDPAKRYQSAQKIRQDLTRQSTVGFPGKDEKDLYIFPGFRSNVRWKKIVGVIGYILMAAYAVGSFMQSLPNIPAFFLELVSISLLWITFLVGSNFARWDRKIFPFRNLPKEISIAVRIAICVLLFSVAFELDEYVRYMVLKLPKVN